MTSEHALTYMLAGYFHQDWNHRHDTWQAVLEEFLDDDPVRVAQVPGDISRLLANEPDDAHLEERLMDMGMAYDPDEGDRAWLLAVRDRVLAAPGDPRRY